MSLRGQLSRLSVGGKLSLIYLLDLTAVIFISGVLINEKFIAINFSRKELVGNAYIGAIREPLLAAANLSTELRSPERALALAAQIRLAQSHHGKGMNSASEAEAFARSLEASDVSVAVLTVDRDQQGSYWPAGL